MSISLEDRLKHLFMPGVLYFPHKIRTQTADGEPELAILDRLFADRGGIAIDVGANRGIYSFALSRAFSRVLAFEPNPELAAFARKKLPSNVAVNEVALGASETNAVLHVPTFGGRHGSHLFGSLVPYGDGPQQTVSVALRTLDSYGLEHVRFIKIDVEGTEFDVLEGAARTIERDRPVLLIELLAGYYEDPLERIRAICTAYGYEACIMDTSGVLKPVGSALERRKTGTRNIVFASQSRISEWSRNGIFSDTD